ncbi:MAG TPA: hypothetical protein VL178_09675 [Pseudomonas sp.]|nr:hypothetical protein [Pseudomonas sp.]
MEKIGAYTDRVTESGEWRTGNPAAGQRATPMLAAYFNMLQRELIAVVLAGEPALSVADDGQLLKAIRAFFRSATNKATELLLGVLRVGTQAEVDAGTLDDVVVTPKKLRWGFTASWGTNGYIIFPSWMLSFILQWGSGTTDANGACTYTFTIPYPNFAWNPLGSVGATSRVVASLVMETPSLTSCRAWVSNSSGTAFASASVRFWVLGR